MSQQREWTVDRAASVLLEAEAAGTGRPPITDEWPGLDLATAYAVQDETLRRRLARGGGLTDAVPVPPGTVLAAHHPPGLAVPALGS
jgi:hypothetical protein